MKILIAIGTRPEAIKMAPVCLKLREKKINHKVLVTGQHREMLDDILKFFEIKPDYDLNIQRDNSSLNLLSANILFNLDRVLEDFNPDLVLVQGDTTTAATISLGTFHNKVRVGHVEAGLRTFNKFSPYPEEINRKLISDIADYHFAPTNRAMKNLLEEGISKNNIIITGNTVIDSLILGISKLDKYTSRFTRKIEESLNFEKKVILVTGHRRENFGDGLKKIFSALVELSKLDYQIVFPVHLNPEVQKIAQDSLQGVPGIFLFSPLSYPDFIWMMAKSDLIISDSGGIQEEAPSLKTPVIVTRDETEREEGIKYGFSYLIGANTESIVKKAKTLLINNTELDAENPYGDGKASERIIDFISNRFI